ncbi:MAG: ABC transporter permease [Pseudomonadota bacterium]
MFCGVAIVLGLAWQVAVTVLAPPTYIMPGPGRVFQALWNHAGYLAENALTTLTEIILGLIAGTVLGVITALTMAAVPALTRVILPVLIISQALPVFAIAPLLVLWFGYGMASKVVMATLIIYFPVASAFFDGLRRTDPGLLDLANLYRTTGVQRLVLFRLPAALPGLVSGLRVAATVAPIGAVVGEWVGSSAGLGFVMLHANARVQTDLMFAALFLLALMAVGLRVAVEAATKNLIFWMPETNLQRSHS